MSSVRVHSLLGICEPVSCFSHLFGALIFALLACFLIPRVSSGRKATVSLVIFSVATVLLLSISGVYHLLSHGGVARMVMQRIDHAAIFVLIAGTFTPVHILLFEGFWNWGVTTFVWLCAATGISLKSIFFSSIPSWLGLSFYLFLGWFGLVSGILLYRRYGLKFVIPLLFGALAYTLGALVDFADRPMLVEGVIGPHELFHFAVLLGISYHWLFVYQTAWTYKIASESPAPVDSKQ